MKVNLTDKITGYHYTNSRAYLSMQTNGKEGYSVPNFNDFSGIIPTRRFMSFGEGSNLPSEAYDGVIEGLLKSEPTSWIENPEFPGLWRYLMHDICRDEKVILLSFQIKPEDKAFVVERAHVEKELYKDPKRKENSTIETRNNAFKKYWNSRVSVFDYYGNYSVPQLTIWSGIEFSRLKVEWEKPTDEVWKRVLDNNW